MSESTQFVDILDMQVSEAGGNVTLASPDFYVPERPLLFPARYYSPTRKLRVDPKGHKDWDTQEYDANNFDFEMDFGRDGLVISPSDPRPAIGAPRDYLNTIPRKSFKGVGEGSAVQQYLTACGFTGVFSLTQAELRDLMFESQNRPVGVRIGWRNDNKHDAEKGMKRVYTTAFKTGEKDGKSIYSPRVTLTDGRVVTARAVVEEYFNPEKWKA